MEATPAETIKEDFRKARRAPLVVESLLRAVMAESFRLYQGRRDIERMQARVPTGKRSGSLVAGYEQNRATARDGPGAAYWSKAW